MALTKLPPALLPNMLSILHCQACEHSPKIGQSALRLKRLRLAVFNTRSVSQRALGLQVQSSCSLSQCPRSRACDAPQSPKSTQTSHAASFQFGFQALARCRLPAMQPQWAPHFEVPLERCTWKLDWSSRVPIVKTWTSAANSTVFDTGHCGNAGELKKVLFHTVPTFQAQVQCCPRMVSVWPDSSMLHCGERAARCPIKAKGTLQRLKAPISARLPFSAAQLSTVRAAFKAEISKTPMDDAAILAALPSWTAAQSAGLDCSKATVRGQSLST